MLIVAKNMLEVYVCERASVNAFPHPCLSGAQAIERRVDTMYEVFNMVVHHLGQLQSYQHTHTVSKSTTFIVLSQCAYRLLVVSTFVSANHFYSEISAVGTDLCMRK